MDLQQAPEVLQSFQDFVPKPHKRAFQPYVDTPPQRCEQKKAHRQTKPIHWEIFTTDFFLNLKAQQTVITDL